MANVVLSNVSKSYGSLEVIEGLNLSIEDGSFTVFVGPSGCGKSTLLRMIAGLEPITKGSLEIDGKPMNEADPIERGVAMVFQNYALYPHMTVEQNIGFSLRMAGLSKEDIASRVAVAAQTLQIEPLLKRKPGQLSGGQRQRVAIGRAIVRDPEVFLFDEPLSNLDAELRVSMRVEIAKLHNSLGSTMIYVTHDQTEAMTLADKIVVMRSGRIEQAGTPEELYDNPDNLFVAGFIGSPRMNFLRATLAGGKVRLETGDEWAAGGPDGAVLVGVRPEHYVEPGSGAAEVSVKVDVVENLGGTRFVYGTLRTGESVVVEARERTGIKAGDVVSFGIRPERVMLFSSSGTRLRNI
ncbi:MAG: sn-glycerol-3-phosphate ABC transporter ATP-binding protein UgpC [Devosia sp.]